VHFLDTLPSSSSGEKAYHYHPNLLHSGIQLTLALTDPDAPSHHNPKWSQVCHWIATDIPLTPSNSGSGSLADVVLNTHHTNPQQQQQQKFTDIMPYKPPGPPPKTGKHRYVFVALAPVNGTTEKLNLSKPEGRRRWGFGGEGEGVREWAGRNGLGVVGEFLPFLLCFGGGVIWVWRRKAMGMLTVMCLGANFVYAEDEEQ